LLGVSQRTHFPFWLIGWHCMINSRLNQPWPRSECPRLSL
jgi:hypothetical protein